MRPLRHRVSVLMLGSFLNVLALAGCGVSGGVTPNEPPGGSQVSQALYKDEPKGPAPTTQTPVATPDGSTGTTSGSANTSKPGEREDTCEVPRPVELVPMPNVAFELSYPKGWTVHYNARWTDTV